MFDLKECNAEYIYRGVAAYEIDGTNPLNIVLNIDNKTKMNSVNIKYLRKVLNNFLNTVLTEDIIFIKEIIIRFALYNNIKNNIDVYKYIEYQSNLIKELILYNKSNKIFISIEDILDLINCKTTLLFKLKLNELKKNEKIFVEVLSNYISIKRFVELKQSVHELDSQNKYLKQMKNIFENVDEHLKCISVGKLIEDCKDIEYNNSLRACFDYILEYNQNLTEWDIEIVIKYMNNKPFLLLTVGYICNFENLIKILIMLLERDFEKKQVSLIELKVLIDKYIGDIFIGNPIIDNFDFMSIGWLIYIENRLNLIKYYKKIFLYKN